VSFKIDYTKIEFILRYFKQYLTKKGNKLTKSALFYPKTVVFVLFLNTYFILNIWNLLSLIFLTLFRTSIINVFWYDVVVWVIL